MSARSRATRTSTTTRARCRSARRRCSCPRPDIPSSGSTGRSIPKSSLWKCAWAATSVAAPRGIPRRVPARRRPSRFSNSCERSESMRLEGSVAIVTGGASGIGEACCRRMIQEGARVAIFDVHPETPAGADVLGIRCDVSDAAQVQGAVDQVLDAFGAVHVLVNSAGIAVRKTVSELEEADWDRCVAVNLKGIYLTSKYVLPHLTN